MPALTAERSVRLAAEGVKYLHCPVFMGPPAARKAQGTMMVAGPRATFDSVQAELAKMTGRLEFMGEQPDRAAVCKLMGNGLMIGLTGVMADVLTLAQAGGVDGLDAIKVLQWLDLNAMVADRGANMAKGNFSPTFELSMARKDVRLMLEAAGDRPMAALPGVAARMDQLIAAGHGSKGMSVLAIDAQKRD